MDTVSRRVAQLALAGANGFSAEVLCGGANVLSKHYAGVFLSDWGLPPRLCKLGFGLRLRFIKQVANLKNSSFVF